jgi:hypothetical protein
MQEVVGSTPISSTHSPSLNRFLPEAICFTVSELTVSELTVSDSGWWWRYFHILVRDPISGHRGAFKPSRVCRTVGCAAPLSSGFVANGICIVALNGQLIELFS